MKKEEFNKLFCKVQTYMELTDWDITYSLVKAEYIWKLYDVDYTRFQAHISFNKDILKREDKESIIRHELCHIYTISSLRYFEKDLFIKDYIGSIYHTEMITRMNIINEQMTVKMERLIWKLNKNA